MSTQTSELSALVARLEKVERQNRRLKVIGTAVVLLLGGTFLLGLAAPEPRVVTAGKFVVADPAGKNWAELGYYADEGGPALLLRDKDGHRVAILGGSPREGAALQLRDKDKPRLNLRTYPDGFAGLQIQDPNGKQRVYLGLPWESEPALHFSDKDNRRVELGHLRADEFGLEVRSKDGRPVFHAP